MKSKPLLTLSVLLLLLALSAGCGRISGVTQPTDNPQAPGSIIATHRLPVERTIPQLEIGTIVEDESVLVANQALVTPTVEPLAAGALSAKQAPSMSGTPVPSLSGQFPDLEGTSQAMLAQAISTPGEIPPDIPVVPGAKEELLAMLGTVSYATPLPYDQVLDFYKQAMPANGWTEDTDGELRLEDAAILNFHIEERSATVTMSVSGDKVYVLIVTSLG